jgi:hypothetical protein
MRVLQRFPTLAEPLRDGRLCSSSVALLAPLLTEENLDELVAHAAYKTKAEVEHLVVSIQPRHAPKNGVRRLPDRTSAPAAPVLALMSPPEDDMRAAPAPVEPLPSQPILAAPRQRAEGGAAVRH